MTVHATRYPAGDDGARRAPKAVPIASTDMLKAIIDRASRYVLQLRAYFYATAFERIFILCYARMRARE